MITVYSYYVLDLIHRGHLLMMKNSKAIAGPDGRLIVGIVSDEAVLKKKGNAPILSFSERLELASAIKYADVVVGQQNYTPYENIEMLKPDILMESESHNIDQIMEGERLVKAYGGKVIVMPYLKEQSSTSIKEQIKGYQK